jgi:hypothetical protein
MWLGWWAFDPPPYMRPCNFPRVAIRRSRQRRSLLRDASPDYNLAQLAPHSLRLEVHGMKSGGELCWLHRERFESY